MQYSIVIWDWKGSFAYQLPDVTIILLLVIMLKSKTTSGTRSVESLGGKGEVLTRNKHIRSSVFVCYCVIFVWHMDQPVVDT